MNCHQCHHHFVANENQLNHPGDRNVFRRPHAYPGRRLLFYCPKCGYAVNWQNDYRIQKHQPLSPEFIDWFIEATLPRKKSHTN